LLVLHPIDEDLSLGPRFLRLRQRLKSRVAASRIAADFQRTGTTRRLVKNLSSSYRFRRGTSASDGRPPRLLRSGLRRRGCSKTGQMATKKSLGKEDAPLSARRRSVRRAVRSYFWRGDRRESFASCAGSGFRLWLGRPSMTSFLPLSCFPWMQSCATKGRLREVGGPESQIFVASEDATEFTVSQSHRKIGGGVVSVVGINRGIVDRTDRAHC